MASTMLSPIISTENLALLSERGRQALERILECDTDGAQQHVYANWPEAGSDDDGKRRLTEQVKFKFTL